MSSLFWILILLHFFFNSKAKCKTTKSNDWAGGFNNISRAKNNIKKQIGTGKVRKYIIKILGNVKTGRMENENLISNKRFN